jgi:hypothetical protein
MAKLIIKNKYGIIPDEILNSKDLSLSAKGLYGYLQSKPDGWKFSINRMSLQLKEGKDAIRKAVLELEKFGLLKRTPIKDKEGKWDGYDYELMGKLAEKPLAENPTTAKPSTDSPGIFSKTDNSKTDNSKTDNSNNNYENEKIAFKKQIDSLIDMFKHVNPTYKRLFGEPPQRKSLERLVKQFGKERVENMIKILPEIFGKPYAPRITTPYQLERKLADLIAYLKSEKSKVEKNKIELVL